MKNKINIILSLNLAITICKMYFQPKYSESQIFYTKYCTQKTYEYNKYIYIYILLYKYVCYIYEHIFKFNQVKMNKKKKISTIKY